MTRLSAPAVALSLVWASDAVAQVAETIPQGPLPRPLTPSEASALTEQVPGALEREAPATRPEATPLPEPDVPLATQNAPANADALTFVLRDVQIEGSNALPRETLLAEASELIGKEITLGQAFEIVGRIQGRYREEGFIFTRAIVPPQEIDEGVFRIRIVEGTIGKVVIEEPAGPVGPPLPLLQGIASRLEGRSNVSLAELERTLLLLNDVPGIARATAVPRPGEGAGTVDLFVNVVRDPISGVLFADNRQSPIFGPGLVGVTLEASSWTAAGDTTTVSFFNSFGDDIGQDIRERHTLQLTHQRHVGTNGTVIRGRALGSLSEPGDTLELLELDGEQYNLAAEVEHPFIRTRPLSLWGSAGFEYIENSIDTTSATVFDDSIRVVYLGGRLEQRDALGFTRVQAQVRQGLDVLDANDGPRNGDSATSRADGNASFTSIRGQIEREVFVPGTTEKLSLYGLATGQAATDALYSSEEFQIGGPLVGRGYDPSEFSGDQGYGLLGEVRFQTSFEAGPYPIGVQVYGFGDYASVSNLEDGPDREEISSYGGGVRLSLPFDFNVTGEVAVPTSRLQRNNEKKPRLFFNLVKRF